MPYCSNCGNKVDANSKFCGECGVAIGGSNNQTKRETVFEGTIHKCPNCGEIVASFETTCKTCGFEFRDTSSSTAVKEFSQKLNELESRKKPDTVLGKLATTIGVSKSNNTTDEQILNYIRTFNVPNTKEDVFEFMILASSCINESAISADSLSDAGANSSEDLNAMKARNDAWKSKIDQVYQKAKLSFGNDPDFKRIQEIYDRTIGTVESAKKEKKKKNIVSWIPIVAILMIAIAYFSTKSISHHSKEQKLEQIVQEIQIDIKNEDYESALIKANGLHMDDGWSSESKEHWDEQREQLIEIIKEKQGDQ